MPPCRHLFLPAITARHLVGISVGIDKHRQRNIMQIQSVMLLDDCRPGAPFRTHLRTILVDAARSSTFLPVFDADPMAVDLDRVDEVSLGRPDWN
jgi:hypothetical protein